MEGPVVFISHNKVVPGKLDGLKAYAPEITDIIRRDKPGTVVFATYTNEEGTEAHIVHVFPDADAMQQHLEGLDERASAAFEFIGTTGYDIYGSPNDAIVQMMRGFAERLGVPLVVTPQTLAGYVHTSG